MKHSLILSLLVILFSSLNETYTPLCAQKILCQRSFGGSDVDYLVDVIQTSDNGLLIGSTSKSGISGDKTDMCFGQIDYWVIKTNKKGEIQWQHTFGGDNEDQLVALLETNDSGFLVCGTSQSGITGNKAVGNLGESDFWVVKLDENGKEEWQNGYGGKTVDQLVAVLPYPEGGYLLTGYAWFEPTATKGRYDYWIVLIDKKGEKKWDLTIGGNHDDMLTDAIVDNNGNIVLTGYSLSGAVGDKTEPCLGYFDYWTVCIDKNKKIIWQKTYGTGKEDRVEKIMQDLNGQYLVGGSTPLNKEDQKLCDYWIVTLDNTGKYVRDLKTGGDDYDFLSTMYQNKVNGIMYAGVSRSGISGDKSEAAYGDLDAWMIKYDRAGKKSWDKTIGGIQYDAINKILPYKGDCYTVFMSTASGKTGNLTQEGKGMYDMVMITIKDKKGKE